MIHVLDFTMLVFEPNKNSNPQLPCLSPFNFSIKTTIYQRKHFEIILTDFCQNVTITNVAAMLLRVRIAPPSRKDRNILSTILLRQDN